MEKLPFCKMSMHQQIVTADGEAELLVSLPPVGVPDAPSVSSVKVNLDSAYNHADVLSVTHTEVTSVISVFRYSCLFLDSKRMCVHIDVSITILCPYFR